MLRLLRVRTEFGLATADAVDQDCSRLRTPTRHWAFRWRSGFSGVVVELTIDQPTAGWDGVVGS